MTVQLMYFKATGKMYTGGEYETKKEHLYEIWREVRVKMNTGSLPGLVKGCTEFIVHVEVPEHPYNGPHIIFPPGLHDVVRKWWESQ